MEEGKGDEGNIKITIILKDRLVVSATRKVTSVYVLYSFAMPKSKVFESLEITLSGQTR
jgi:hypothetical protein